MKGFKQEHTDQKNPQSGIFYAALFPNSDLPDKFRVNENRRNTWEMQVLMQWERMKIYIISRTQSMRIQISLDLIIVEEKTHAISIFWETNIS